MGEKLMVAGGILGGEMGRRWVVWMAIGLSPVSHAGEIRGVKFEDKIKVGEVSLGLNDLWRVIFGTAFWVLRNRWF